MAPTVPYISLEMEESVQTLTPTRSATDVITRLMDGLPDHVPAPKKFYHYLPLCGTIALLLSPHPSVLIILVRFHYQTLHQPLLAIAHLAVIYTLTFLTFSSLIVCVVRDPGPTTLGDKPSGSAANDDARGVTQALMTDEDYSAPGKWCRVCWGPKPERTHHCRQCDRCVLKMDHHCPWLGAKCIGHRTYPAFVHFLFCVTLLATYITIFSSSALWYAFNNPLAVDEFTPVHELFIAFEGAVFAIVIGSFLGYHIYLISTNQTTVENINQFILLKHIPPVPVSPSGFRRLSDPPMEHELSYEQRNIVRHAHGHIRLYDVGWRRNWGQVFGVKSKWGWLYRIWLGGGGFGDGRSFPRNVKSDGQLAKLSKAISEADKDS